VFFISRVVFFSSLSLSSSSTFSSFLPSLPVRVVDAEEERQQEMVDDRTKHQKNFTW